MTADSEIDLARPDRRAGFFSARWRGAVDPATVLWRDMLVVGTLVNAAAMFASLMALGFKAPLWAVWAIHLAPVPYNLFLCLALWRSTARGGAAAATMRAAAAGWLLVATLV